MKMGDLYFERESRKPLSRVKKCFLFGKKGDFCLYVDVLIMPKNNNTHKFIIIVIIT